MKDLHIIPMAPFRPTRTQFRVQPAFIVAVTLALSSQTFGSDYWYSTTGGNYHDASNWYYGTVPSAGDNAYFYLNGQNGTVSLSQWATPNQTYFGYVYNPTSAGYTSYGTFDMNGNTWATGYLRVGEYDGYHGGNVPGSSGVLSIEDGRFTVTTGVAMMGDSELTITNGGQLIGSRSGFFDPRANLSIGQSSTAARSLKFEVNGAGSSATFDGGLLTNTTGINYADIIVKNGGELSFGQTGTIGRAHVQIDGAGSVMSFGSTLSQGNANFASNRDSSLTVSNGGVLRTLNGGSVNFSSNDFYETTVVLSNGVIDASGPITKGSRSTISGHGILIGNSNSLTISSPNGAVDTSYDMNIGSRRADIFSNAPATLRGDVSLSTGGLLNSAQIVHLIGSEYTQNGGTTSIGNQFSIDNGTMIHTAGAVNVGTEVSVGHQVGSNSTYTISGGTLNTGTLSSATDPDLEVGYSGTGTFNQSGGVVTVADELVIGHNSTGNGTVNLSGGTLNVSKDAGTGVYVGFRGTGELAVSGTGQLSTQSVVSVGTDVGSIGTVTQTGGSISAHQVILADAAGAQATYSMQGGTLNTTSHLYVGEADAATYSQTGGDVTVGSQFRINNGSMATINNGTLHSVDSLRVGTSAGLSGMTQNGGLVKTDEYFAIGSGGDGTYTLTGGTLEAKAVDRGLYVGTEAGSIGSMNQSGGNVDVGDLVVGNGSSQSGEYMLSNGRIDARDRIVVGNHVVGTFNQSGGIINASSAPVTVGNVATADGSAYSMSGGTLSADSLVVGNYGDATFTQTAGAVNASQVVIAQRQGTTASYSLTGGTLTTDVLRFGDGAGPETSSGSFLLDGGTLNVGTLDSIDGVFSFESGTLNANNVTLATLNMNNGLLDVGTLNGDLNMSGGTLAPGNSPGITTINGDYILSGGLLDMELAGLMQGTEYDFLDINGDWTITGGDLQISLLGGFSPIAGNSFDLFDFNSLTGTFDNVLLPTLGSGLAWNTSALYSTGAISVSAAAVPEPSTFTAIGLGLGFVAWRRRRQTAEPTSQP